MISILIGTLRDERDRLKIDCIDLKQEVMELRSKLEFSEKNILVLSQQLVEAMKK